MLNINQRATAYLYRNTRTRLLGWYFTNTSDAWVYLKLYDAASVDDVDPATSVPKRVFAIPPADGANQLIPPECIIRELEFLHGIVGRATLGRAHTATDDPTDGSIIVNLFSAG